MPRLPLLAAALLIVNPALAKSMPVSPTKAARDAHSDEYGGNWDCSGILQEGEEVSP